MTLIDPIGWQISSQMIDSPWTRKKTAFFRDLWKTLKSGYFAGRSWFLERWSIWSSFRAPFAHVRIQVPVFWEVVSTPTENTVIHDYFSKITHFIEIWACTLAGFGWSMFFAPVFYLAGGCEKATEDPILPAKAITSENWSDVGFFQVFWVLPWFSFFVNECRSGFRTKILLIMFMHRACDHRSHRCFYQFSFNHQISNGWFLHHDLCNGRDLPVTG
jgi:hypothetical protein